ncbi:S-layer protein [Calothrix sp. NIES-4101]|nr:S-layer protein [Calothrix sp. NIES-4101]
MKKTLIAIALAGSFLTTLSPLVLPGLAISKPQQNVTSDTSLKVIQQTLSFADIQGVYGEKEIRQLSQLGVIEIGNANFFPSSPITRSQFITWLVKTYNILQTHNTRKPAPIKLPNHQNATFPDVPPEHPAFLYIQAAYDAGFLVGNEDGTFRPDANLTREEMIVLKSPLDSQGSGNSNRSVKSLRSFIQKTKGFTDADQINERYLNHIAFDLGNAASGKNFQRVYGSNRLFAPQKAVTKAEAAVVLSEFRKAGTVSQALDKINRNR